MNDRIETGLDPAATISPWCCPRCHGALQVEAGGPAHCPACQQEFPRDPDGYLDLLVQAPYWGEIPQADAERLVQMTRRDGPHAAWQALRPELQDPALPDYALSPRRAAFLPALLPEGRQRALDIGAGYGAVARGLTEHFDEVVAVEPVRERIGFLALCGARGAGRLEPVRSSWWAIPLAPATLDLITVIGVLEWVGMESPAGRGAVSPRTLQREFLAGLRELLRPGGRVIIGIENRFGLDLWRGAPDHLGHRYTSLVPRWVADRVVRGTGRGVRRLFHGDAFAPRYPSYRVWTYGRRGYQRLALDAGFDSVTVLPCWGSYVWPQLIGSSASVAQQLEARATRGTLAPLRRAAWRFAGESVVRALAPSYFVVAQR